MLAPAAVDAERAERLGEAGRAALAAGRQAEASARLREALGLFRGAPLSDFRYEAFARLEADRLEELRASLAESRIDADLALGRHAELVPELEALVAEHPLRERPRAQLMLALYGSGRQADALAAFQEARRVLVEELGLEPGEELQELHRRILNQDPALAVGRAADDAARPATPPVPPTRLVGRERELDETDALLARPETRLLTLTGPGGTGKTRLALALASRAAARYADGACFVPLAALSDPELVPAELVRALGVREAPGADPAATALRELEGRELLLVVDNLEQLLPAAPFVAELLAAAPGLDVVATSRAPLRLQAEHEYPVPPLAEAEAVELFLERARAVRPDVEGDAGTTLELVRRLDGLPLALELAAARVRLLDLSAIVERLDRALALLTGGARDVPERQRTLRAAVAWSEELLEPEERELFRGLSVFAGAFELESAERVCEAELDTLATLVDHALLTRVPGAGPPRFRMLFVIREYAAGRLEESGEAAARRRAHAEWAAAFAREANAQLAGARQAEWLDRLTLAHDDFRAAFAWALEAEPALALRLAGQLDRFWRIQGHVREATDALERALAATEGETADRASALSVLGVIAADRGDVGRAARAHEEALALRRTLGDPALVAVSLNNVGTIAHAAGDHARASELYEESLRLHEEAGQTRGVAIALNNLGDIARDAGDTARALDLQERSVALCRGLDDEWLLALAVSSLAQTLVAVDPSRAAELVGESLRLASALGNRARLANCGEILAAIAARSGAADDAARLLGKSAALRDELAIELETDQLEDHRATVELVRSAVGADRLAELELEGRELGDESLAAYAEGFAGRVGVDA